MSFLLPGWEADARDNEAPYAKAAGLLHWGYAMPFRILESRMYRDPMLVLEAKQEAEARQKRRQAERTQPSAARRATEALFDIPPRPAPEP
ncbi:hypothetical protein FEP82_05964 [Burkholderia multivorans]|uniref:hypothetical protein n=2 Tax=Burkholderia multivorans TaxID=87883 RepID=UPI001FC8CB45|nr:hypothetical protein [Burkholderia multivorans]MDR8787967.1 hypothetical protein [Burkholderia multivorans]MDR8828922.1 hypothetical protein [Burkholderia multivorans]